MAEQQQPNATAATFPSPPPFYEHFTPENLERIATLRDAQQKESENRSLNASGVQEGAPASPTLRILNLPPELRFLQRPALPSDGIYRSFGDIFSVSNTQDGRLNLLLCRTDILDSQLNEGLPSLKEQGIEQLYTSPSTPSADGSTHSDRALVLKRIAKSLLLNFLELMGIMSVNPEQYMEKIQDLRTLFINFHHLLNEYRPHQARESLIMMMEEQLEKCRAETEGVERMKGKVESILYGLGQANLGNTEDDSNKAGNEELTGGREAQLKIWDELEKEFS